METLVGGTTFVITKTDTAQETVQIRQLPVRLLPQMLAALEDEPAMVELFCDKPQGWSDSLSPESFEHIITEGERINADFFSRWAQRRIQRVERLLPGSTAKLVANLGLPSPISSLK
jgi:hypothetical protein